MPKSSNSPVSVKEVYKNRSQFVLLGLTGRTGSGCTTSSSILSSTFKEIKAPKPKLIDDNDERKYRIVYEFSKKNWKPYFCIQIKDIITSFVIEYKYKEFLLFLKNDVIKDKVLYEEISTEINSLIKIKYNDIYEKRQQLIKDRKEIEGKPTVNNKKTKQIRERLYEFYFDELPNFTDELKNILNKYSGNLYTSVYQLVGNNLRSSGKPFKGNYDGKNIYRIAIRVNKVIKILRRLRGKSKKTYVAIDTFRNPFEISFFRERYSAFYLLAISTEYHSRINRLKKGSDINDSQLREIDKEYDKKLKGDEVFYSQDIGSCIQLADIHVNNPEISVDDVSVLKKQLIYYTSLILHPGLVTPSHLERCMQIAYNAKLNSGCLSRQVGSVITDEYYSIRGVGWNSVPEGHVPCLLRSIEDLLNSEDKEAYSDYELNNNNFRKQVREFHNKDTGKEDNQKKLKGLPIPYCFKDIKNSLDGEKNQVHTRALHAEENAFLQITKYGGVGIKGGKLFVTASPCELCSKKAYQLGIKTIVFIDPYPGIAKEHILKCGKKRPELKLFHGAIGRAYSQLYEPLLGYKDELGMILG